MYWTGSQATRDTAEFSFAMCKLWDLEQMTAPLGPWFSSLWEEVVGADVSKIPVSKYDLIDKQDKSDHIFW